MNTETKTAKQSGPFSQFEIHLRAGELRSYGMLAEAGMLHELARLKEALEPLRKWVETLDRQAPSVSNECVVLRNVFVSHDLGDNRVRMADLRAIFQQPTAGEGS